MNIPFIENEEIWKQADAFRASRELVGNNLPPIDVLYIVDVALGFDVIDIPNLFADLQMDAAIVPGARVKGTGKQRQDAAGISRCMDA
jgi:hypothetical protein